jgi:hypothetical protein
MNERIKELATEARLLTGWPRQAVGEVEYQKFAELMVRDCAEFVQFYYKDHRHVCEVIAYDMKQHFGVEE